MWPFHSKWYSEERKHIEARLADTEQECITLRKERNQLKHEVEDLKLKRKIEEEDIKHMIKIKDESLELEFKKKEVVMIQEKDKEVAAIKDSYRDKIELNLNKRGDELKSMYGEILARLPNITANLELGSKRK